MHIYHRWWWYLLIWYSWYYMFCISRALRVSSKLISTWFLFSEQCSNESMPNSKANDNVCVKLFWNKIVQAFRSIGLGFQRDIVVYSNLKIVKKNFFHEYIQLYLFIWSTAWWRIVREWANWRVLQHFFYQQHVQVSIECNSKTAKSYSLVIFVW